MTAYVVAFLIAFSTTTSAAEHSVRKKPSGFDKLLRAMFTPNKPKPSPAPKRKTKPKEKNDTPPKIHERIYKTVDAQWMARYWELEAAWDYDIPEDDLIEFKEGKYRVPVVVYRHFEDMVNTPRRGSVNNRHSATGPFE